MFNQNHIVDLKITSGETFRPIYAVIQLTQLVDDSKIFLLTSSVMQWDQHCFILNLLPCQHYWLLQAEKSQCSVLTLMKQVLDMTFDQPYVCIFASHPWPALVLNACLSEQKKTGIYSMDGVLSQRIYENISWDHWFKPQKILALLFEQTHRKRFSATQFRSRQRQMQRFIKRMNFEHVFDLSEAEVLSIHRRFSGALGDIWQWTFNGIEEKVLLSEDSPVSKRHYHLLNGFPWIAFELSIIPGVSRDLEFPIIQWDNIKPLFINDLLRLCQSGELSHEEHVTSLTWTVTLYHFKKIDIHINFRNPYDLFQEQPGFETALSQTYYAFIQYIEALRKRQVDLDMPDNIPFVSWEISICGRVYRPLKIYDLFVMNQKDGVNYNDIMDLQNRLPERINHYYLKPDYFPGAAFSQKSLGHFNKTSSTLSVIPPVIPLDQWRFAAYDRPYYFYEKPIPIEEPKSCFIKFIERTANNWWESDSVSDVIRDYFTLQEGNKFYWVFKNERGAWFKHGSFS